MKHEVIGIASDTAERTIIGYGLSKKGAIKLAKETIKSHPTWQIFITFFRASDQQHGYLNSYGYDINGRAW